MATGTVLVLNTQDTALHKWADFYPGSFKCVFTEDTEIAYLELRDANLTIIDKILNIQSGVKYSIKINRPIYQLYFVPDALQTEKKLSISNITFDDVNILNKLDSPGTAIVYTKIADLLNLALVVSTLETINPQVLLPVAEALQSSNSVSSLQPSINSYVEALEAAIVIPNNTALLTAVISAQIDVNLAILGLALVLAENINATALGTKITEAVIALEASKITPTNSSLITVANTNLVTTIVLSDKLDLLSKNETFIVTDGTPADNAYYELYIENGILKGFTADLRLDSLRFYRVLLKERVIGYVVGNSFRTVNTSLTGYTDLEPKLYGLSPNIGRMALNFGALNETIIPSTYKVLDTASFVEYTAPPLSFESDASFVERISAQAVSYFAANAKQRFGQRKDLI